MAHIRTYDEIGETTAAEAALIDACRKGEHCELGDGMRPDEGYAGDDRRIRAELLRYLLLGGCEECSAEDGVTLVGAVISGTLDLRFRDTGCQITLINCRFENAPILLQTRCKALILPGSATPGLMAQGIKVEGNVFLRNGFHARGEVSLSGATIGELLACEGGRFENETGLALNAQGVDVKGDVLLKNGFHASGQVRLAGATIGGQLVCEDGRFENETGDALNAQKATVGGEFIWRNVKVAAGTLHLPGLHAGTLVDDLKSWPEAGRCYLDGFTYDRIAGAPTDAATRLEWLARVDQFAGEFFPQPYVQLARVLREMGHEADARRVLLEKENRLRRHVRQRARVEPDGTTRAGWLSLWADTKNIFRRLRDTALKYTVGYGHAPGRSAVILVVLFAIASSLAQAAWNEGSFAPNSGPILVSEGWQSHATNPQLANPAAAWSAKGAPGQDWESFNAISYGADVVIPIIDFAQTSAWAPSTARGPWGRNLWWARWVLGALGWIVSALGAAAVTGIIKRE